MVSRIDMEKYRAVLLAQQESVQDQIQAISSWCEPVAPDQAIGRLTRNDAMQDQQMALHQRERLLTQLTRIRTALDRIESGTFGICPACKNSIDVRRLDTAPDSPLCVACLEKLNASPRPAR
jgi:DnaK suppressor protein